MHPYIIGMSALMFLHDECRFVMQETTLDNVTHLMYEYTYLCE